MGPVAPVHSALSPENVARVMRSIGSLTNRGAGGRRQRASGTSLKAAEITASRARRRRYTRWPALAPAYRWRAPGRHQGDQALSGNIGEAGPANIFTGENVALDPRMHDCSGGQGRESQRSSQDKAALPERIWRRNWPRSTALRNLPPEQLKDSRAGQGWPGTPGPRAMMWHT